MLLRILFPGNPSRAVRIAAAVGVRAAYGTSAAPGRGLGRATNIAPVPRFLIVGGGCRGRRLAAELLQGGDAVRITTRDDRSRGAIERVGAECWTGTPDRLATLRGALDGVTVACWLLATATGDERQLRALHDTRLEFFLTQAIDSTVRAFLYEAPSAATSVPPEVLAHGAPLVAAAGERNRMPVAFLRADPAATDEWLREAHASISSLLDPSREEPPLSAPGPSSPGAILG